MKKWDRRMINVAKEVSSWSKDPERQVGCVLTNFDYHIISTGYNGYPKGVDDANPNEKLFKSVHAEINAILRIPWLAGNLRCFVYGGHPCAQCMASLIQANVKYFVVPNLELSSSWTESMETARGMVQDSEDKLVYLNYI